MPINFRSKNGQVAPFMVMVMAVLILAIAATVVIGETGYVRLRMANIADSALISGVSAFCRSLNSIRPLHNKMLMNYISLQTALLVASPFSNKIQAYVCAIAWTALSVEQNYDLFSSACDIADKMPQQLRSSTYDSAFGGALIDEPKPFIEKPGITPYHQMVNGAPILPDGTSIYTVDTCNDSNLSQWNEVGRDSNGVVNYLDYTKYLQRDSRFACQYRTMKFANSGWYGSGQLAYSFNKSKTKFDLYPGIIGTSPDNSTLPLTGERVYDAYLQAQLSGFPDSVDITPMPMVVIFFYIIYCPPFGEPCGIMPGFMPDPFAWIATVDFNSNFSLVLNKRVPFTRIPFFSQSVDLQHTSSVSIRGNVWSGWEFSIR